MPNAQCPMPTAQWPCPMPNAQCPMPNAQCPLPNAQCPLMGIAQRLTNTPNAQCPMPPTQVLKCAHAHEYGDTFGSHGLGGMLVGLTEEEDSYLVLLAHALGLSLAAFEASLPLMVATPPPFLGMDPAAFRDLEHELASSAQVRDQLRNSTAKEFVVYDEARSMYEAQRDAYPGGEAALARAAQDLTLSKLAWRKARKLGLVVPFACPLDEHTSALLPQLDWSRSGLGATGTGEGFAYCSRGPAWPTSDCMRAEDTCLPSAPDCVTSAAEPVAAPQNENLRKVWEAGPNHPPPPPPPPPPLPTGCDCKWANAERCVAPHDDGSRCWMQCCGPEGSLWP